MVLKCKSANMLSLFRKSKIRSKWKSSSQQLNNNLIRSLMEASETMNQLPLR